MDSKTHYLTTATFLVKNKDESINEVTIDDHAPQKAIIRKLCICGSVVEYDLDEHKWRCHASGTELDGIRWNCGPLVNGKESDSPKLDISNVRDPRCNSAVTIGESGELIVLFKVELKDRWIISDPLPIFDHLTVKPFETDLLLNWFLNIEDYISSGLFFNISWNVSDLAHRKIIERLATSKSVMVYFLEADLLLPIASTVLQLYPPSIQLAVAKALALNAALPKDERERREKLSSLELDHEASMLSFMDKLGLCPQLAGYMCCSPSNDTLEEMMEHMKTCPLCKRPPEG